MTYDESDPTDPTPPGRRPVPRDELRRTAWLAHLRSHLGPEAVVLCERASLDVHLDLVVFPPSPDRTFVTVVTSGMADVPTSGSPSAAGEEAPRVELAIAVPLGWPGLDPLAADPLHDEANYWPLRVLKLVARLPGDSGTDLRWGDTVGRLESLYPAGTPFSGAVLGPPVGLPPAITGHDSPPGRTLLLAVFPTTPSEMDYRTSLPGGGDSLLERLLGAGVSMAVNPARPPAVAAPPYALHVLYDRVPAHLGEVLEPVVPNYAARLAEEGRAEAVFPPEPSDRLPQVRMRVGPRLDPALLADHVADDPALTAVVDEHWATVTLFLEGEVDPDDLPTSPYSFAKQLAEAPGPTAVWLPHQRRVLSAADYVRATDAEPITLASVHETTTPEGGPAARTHGLAAVGGREIWFDEPGMTGPSAVKRVTAMLDGGGDGELPRPGDQVRYGFTRYGLTEGTVPGTGEPVLVMAEEPKGRRRLFGRQA
ncbi:suppressor of fused domain protein [uncultured Nocardioides sp.]|uniref:suppressor of fused domain protein n=1 Tax=uncultured Nocardioides sp. TaxID=198441 RepID=UPI00261D6532|nr:suppressor of fused domain protein [uncultured Nocardioides sp.]